MKPLIVLIAAFLISLLVLRFITGSYDFDFSGRIAMSIMLLFTTIGHFAYTKGMEMMIPNFLPYKRQLVYVTGVIEFLAAVGLLIPNLQYLTGILLILFFILILPANIYAANHQVDYQKGTLNGPGLKYLGFRIPLQFFFITWVYFSAIVA